MEPRLLLRSVKIENIRALRGTHFHELVNPRGRPVFKAVIAGMNGSGKTTFLESILIGLRRYGLLAQTRVVANRLIVPEGGRIELELDVQSAPGTALETRCPCVLRVRYDKGYSASVLTEAGEEPLEIQQADAVLDRIQVAYFSERRQAASSAGAWRLFGMAVNSDREEHRLLEVKNRLLAEPKSDKTQAWLARINEAWKFWTCYDESVIKVLDTPLGPDLFISSDGLDIPLADAGSGDLDWLALFGSLITEEFSGLLLIDNPEMHMDASNQGQLLRCLEKTFPGSQFIVATQSNEAWEYAHSYERYLPY
jgi:predicted ATPase